jgi:hypothetical protein
MPFVDLEELFAVFAEAFFWSLPRVKRTQFVPNPTTLMKALISLPLSMCLDRLY